jgi:4-amino-4-deoxy-L-arabinose transferase-like glycosyltransferase
MGGIQKMIFSVIGAAISVALIYWLATYIADQNVDHIDPMIVGLVALLLVVVVFGTIYNTAKGFFGGDKM